MQRHQPKPPSWDQLAQVRASAAFLGSSGGLGLSPLRGDPDGGFSGLHRAAVSHMNDPMPFEGPEARVRTPPPTELAEIRVRGTQSYTEPLRTRAIRQPRWANRMADTHFPSFPKVAGPLALARIRRSSA